MKRSLLILITPFLLLSCSNSKKTVENNPQESPQAELQLAPGHIHAKLEVISIQETETQKIVSAIVIEILNYGSSTDPVPAGTTLQFGMNDSFSQDLRNKVKNAAILDAVLFKQGDGVAMGQKNKSNYWKLISINN